MSSETERNHRLFDKFNQFSIKIKLLIIIIFLCFPLILMFYFLINYKF